MVKFVRRTELFEKTPDNTAGIEIKYCVREQRTRYSSNFLILKITCLQGY